jgi:hypothetical protein
MTTLRNSILATLAYYDIFEYPLGADEVFRFLINPVRLGGSPEEPVIKSNHVTAELDKLANVGIIGKKNGFYFLKGKEKLCKVRTRRQQIAERKWKKFLRMVKFLSLAPYLRGVFASGSMALNNTDDKSDFDVLIITRSGRLYTCRFFLWLITSILGVRRKKDERIAPDKLCFNHYITEDGLHIPHESIFNAQTYINLKPMLIDMELRNKFYSNNLWIRNYMYDFKPGPFPKNSSGFVLFKFFAGILELVFNSFLGDVLEGRLKKIQQRKIKENPVTYQGGGRIVYNDRELEFHPFSFEKNVIEKYNISLRDFGINIKEKDSGLLF